MDDLEEFVEELVSKLKAWSTGDLEALTNRHRGFCYNFYKEVEDLEPNIKDYILEVYKDSWETWPHNSGDPNYAVPESMNRAIMHNSDDDLWDDSVESMLRKDLTGHTAQYIVDNFNELEIPEDDEDEDLLWYGVVS